MTTTTRTRPAANESSSPVRSGWMAIPAMVVRSRWLPAAAAFVGGAATLLWFDVPPLDLVKFFAYVLGALTVPGALLWRVAHRGSRPLVEDLAAGTAVGYAGQVLCYVPARAHDLPLLPMLFPLGVIAAFAGAPGLRRFWRGGGAAARPPLVVAWFLSVAVIFLIAWSAATFFVSHGLDWPANGSPNVDIPFHLALAAELKHHAPPVIPYIAGEPLNYHWFIHANMAATSWVTGIELQTLLYRLAMVPMLASITVLIVTIAVRLTGRWWTGPAAFAVAFLSVPAALYPWSATSFFSAQNISVLWTSPSNTFGLTLGAAATLVLIGLLGRAGAATPAAARRSDVGRWLLYLTLIAAVMGAKATFLPMLFAGLLVVLVGDLVARRPTRNTMVAIGITGSVLVFAQFVLFGGSDGASRVDPLATAGRFPVARLTSLTDATQSAHIGVLGTLAALAVVTWAMQWAGIFGLSGPGRRIPNRPVLLLTGMSVAGLGAFLMIDVPGWSQMYFGRAAGPFLGVLAVVGLSLLVPPGHRRLRVPAAVALAGGSLAATFVFALGRSTPPTVGVDGGAGSVLLSVALPWLIFVGATAIVGIALSFARRRWAWSPGVPLALTLLFAMGAGLPHALTTLSLPITSALVDGRRPTLLADGRPEIGDDELAAARWLRDNSRPNDLVATNAHCRPTPIPVCDNLHFWLAGYSERRILVEGWGYSYPANKISMQTGLDYRYVPYWRPEVLRDNDAAFSLPTREVVDRLRTTYGVRWLFADARWKRVSPDLGTFAVLRFQVGHCAVYEIVP